MLPFYCEKILPLWHVSLSSNVFVLWKGGAERLYMRILSVLLLSLAAVLCGFAVEQPPLPASGACDNDTAQQKSVCVYDSWQALYAYKPDTVFVDLQMTIKTPYVFDFSTGDKKVDRRLHNQALAIAYGDSTYFVNTRWLKDNGFKGQLRYMSDFVPLYFTEKAAFVQFRVFAPDDPLMLYLVYSGIIDLEDESTFNQFYSIDQAPYFLIDFEAKRVDDVDHKLLSKLLSRYINLLRSYESLHDYKKTYVINQFFIDYLRELDDDDDVPCLFQ